MNDTGGFLRDHKSGKKCQIVERGGVYFVRLKVEPELIQGGKLDKDFIRQVKN